jgi:hypothetical protein
MRQASPAPMARRDSPGLRRLVRLLLFLVLIDEARSEYAEHVFSLFTWVRPWLLDAVFEIRPIDVMLGGVLALAAVQGAFRTSTTRPMKRTLYGAAAVTVLALVYGLATGGNARAAGWQAYLPMSMVLASFAIAATHQTAEHFRGLFKVFVVVAVWHAVMCIVFHLAFITSGRLPPPLPEYDSTHDDTVIWTVVVAGLFLQALQFPTTRNKVLAGVVVPVLLVAIQYNRRRLAWISLIASLLTLYFFLPASAAKRRIQRMAALAVPVLLLYVVIGWGRPEGIFRPLKSFQTVSGDEDKSTHARVDENLGLIATVNQSSWLLGSGWGHKYVEISNRYQIYFFELWPYVPHNSVLGLFAYTGYLGFLGYWMSIPMAAFFHARVARKSERIGDRFVGMVAMFEIVACADQWYGDMGSFSQVTMFTLATSIAAALRLPVASGVWSNSNAPRPADPRGV